MTNLSVKKLFRRCLLIAFISVAAGCANVKQMPSSSVSIEERSFKESNEVKRKLEFLDIKIQEQPVLSTVVKIPDTDLVLETPVDTITLTNYISSKFKVSLDTAIKIVQLATKHAYETFPKRDDILAIISVESRFNINAFSQGCYGLMQVQKKSHTKPLAGRSLRNPDVNIELGSKILNEYSVLLKGNKKAAVLAFNSGIGNYNKRRYKLEYYTKYNAELKLISSL